MKKIFIIYSLRSALSYIWIGLLAGVLTACSGAEGGVRMANEMEKYAIDYIEANQLLAEGEKIIAYYDYTISLDGTVAVMLTNMRVLYHNRETQDSFIVLSDITDIRHRQQSVIGDIIEIYSKQGDVLKVEIAPFNQGESFLNALHASMKIAH